MITERCCPSIQTRRLRNSHRRDGQAFYYNPEKSVVVPPTAIYIHTAVTSRCDLVTTYKLAAVTLCGHDAGDVHVEQASCCLARSLHTLFVVQQSALAHIGTPGTLHFLHTLYAMKAVR